MDWYVRGKDGSNLNSGGTNSSVPELEIDDLQVIGTRATSRAGGFRTTTSKSINVQDSGDSIRLFEVIDDRAIIFSSPLFTVAGTFRARVGGARVSINRTANSGACNNPSLRESDKVHVQGGIYCEEVELDVPCSVSAFDGVVQLDGTGMGSGSSPLQMVAGASVNGFTIYASVDHGIAFLPYRSILPNRLQLSQDKLGHSQEATQGNGTQPTGGMMLDFLKSLFDALRGAEPSQVQSPTLSQSQQSQVGHTLQNVVVNASGGDGIFLPQVQRVTQGYPSSMVRAAFYSGMFLGSSLGGLAWVIWSLQS